jgi:secreted Zn-dependent insulinase-like peptidase
LENYEVVLAALYKYAQKIRDTGPQDYLFAEIKRVGQLNFDFASQKPEVDYVVSLARTM